MGTWFSTSIVTQITWFRISDFCNAKRELVEYGIKDHEVRDSNDIEVGFRLVGAPMRRIKSP